jgi:hypothetical protein
MSRTERYTITTRTTYAVTERSYPFNAYEKQGIVLERGSKAEEFWMLFVHTGEELLDPMTLVPMGTIDATERRAAAANDEEMRLCEQYFELMDRIDRYDELLGKGVLEKGVNRTRMVNQSNKVFLKWEMSRELVKGYEDAWLYYRDRRVDNLEKALGIHEALVKEEESSSPSDMRKNYPWWPSPLLIQSIREEIDTLNQGMRLSDRYMTQLTLAEVTGRPLFSAKELTDDGFMVEDPYHRAPVGNSLQDRIALVLAS